MGCSKTSSVWMGMKASWSGVISRSTCIQMTFKNLCVIREGCAYTDGCDLRLEHKWRMYMCSLDQDIWKLLCYLVYNTRKNESTKLHDRLFCNDFLRTCIRSYIIGNIIAWFRCILHNEPSIQHAWGFLPLSTIRQLTTNLKKSHFFASLLKMTKHISREKDC